MKVGDNVFCINDYYGDFNRSERFFHSGFQYKIKHIAYTKDNRIISIDVSFGVSHWDYCAFDIYSYNETFVGVKAHRKMKLENIYESRR